MEIKGLDKLIDTFDNASNNFDKEGEEFLNRVANRLLGKVKARTPVDTGQLRRSWQVKRISSTERKIFNNTKYALPIEFGHRTRGGKSFVSGRYMLTKSVEEIQDELGEELEIMMENLFR